MARYREYRRIYSYKVRELCKQDELYTNGTDEEYSHLLNTLCDEDVDQTMDSLEEITEDILKHSAVKRLMMRFGCDEEELFGSILWEVINECCKTFVEKI